MTYPTHALEMIYLQWLKSILYFHSNLSFPECSLRTSGIGEAVGILETWSRQSQANVGSGDVLLGESLASGWFLMEAATGGRWFPGLPGLSEDHRACIPEPGGCKCPRTLGSSASPYHEAWAPLHLHGCWAPAPPDPLRGGLLALHPGSMHTTQHSPTRASWEDHPGFSSGTATKAMPTWRLYHWSFSPQGWQWVESSCSFLCSSRFPERGNEEASFWFLLGVSPRLSPQGQSRVLPEFT